MKTLACLDSLFQAALPDNFAVEVFLVDDKSTDGTADLVKKNYPQVNIIQGDGNLYWNRGMNLAWQTASEKLNYDFYLWLNDDVVLDRDFILNLINDYNNAGDSNTIIAGACKSEKGNVTYSGYSDLRKKKILSPSGKIQQCEYFNGNVVLISNEVVKRVGLLDPIFHHGQGDFDYGLRANKLGVKSYVSSHFTGVCEKHHELPQWCNPRYSFVERWKSFNSPLGGRPKSTLIFQKRYVGLATALFHYFTIHIRLVIPKIWTRK